MAGRNGPFCPQLWDALEEEEEELLVAPAVRTRGGREPSQAREERRGEERRRIDRHNGVAQASGQVRSDDDNGDNRGKQGG